LMEKPTPSMAWRPPKEMPTSLTFKIVMPAAPSRL
jgi:hypothetical protein